MNRNKKTTTKTSTERRRPGTTVIHSEISKRHRAFTGRVLEPAFELELEPETDYEEPASRRDRQDALAAVLDAAFAASVDKATTRRLQRGQALAVVIKVPTPAWLKPMESHFRTFGPKWQVRCYDKKTSGLLALEGATEIAADLSAGLCVAGICVDNAAVPNSLSVSADFAIEIKPPVGETLRKAITTFCNRNPGELPLDLGAGLDLTDMLACFRPGSGPERIACRIATAAAVMRGSATAERLPDISTAVEYGPAARGWALQLAQDVADFRRSAIGWQDFQSPAIALASEPGIGKDFFARAVAHHLGLPIVICNVADWFVRERSYIDDVIRSIRQTWDRCSALVRVHGLCVLHLTECDGIPNRATVDNRNRDYWSVIIGDLLARCEMASPERHGIILIGSTNQPQGIDAALLRPGRFERLVTIERPDLAGTLSMLRFQIGDAAIGDAEMREIAGMVERSTGAEIAALVREGRAGARRAGEAFAARHLRAAVFTDGEAPPWRICLHEAGHAALTLATGFGSLRHASVGARHGETHRTVIDFEQEDVATREQIELRAIMLLGGRAAERVLLNGASIGAETDLRKATLEIGAAHMSWGLADNIAHLGRPQEVAEALRFDRGLRDLVERDLRDIERRADELAHRHRDAVEAIARALQQRRHLSGDAAREIFAANAPKVIAIEETAP